MTLSISQKLVAAFVGLTLLVLTATLGLARWSFEQGFLDYVNALEQQRLERVQIQLAKEYVSAGGSWQSLDEQRFAALMRRSEPRGSRDRPPPEHRRPPPMGDSNEVHPPPPGRPGPEGRRRGRKDSPPMGFYDMADNLIAGVSVSAEDKLAIRMSIVVEETTVGELRTEPQRQITSPLETEFSKQQLTTSWLIGIASLVLAIGASLFLARSLLAPVKRMIDSVAQLSSGNYAYRVNESRSDELGQLTTDLDKLGSTLAANQASRKRLLADVSHELRTPITVLAGEIEAMKDGLREFDERQLESLDQEVQRLRHLVDDLYELSISDLGGLRYQFSPIDLTVCLQETVEGIHKRAAAMGIEVLLEKPDDNAPVMVAADAQRIHQLLQNLFENSLAYTDSPGRVLVALSQTQALAKITVDDTSPGVDSSDCERLFDPLFRQEASRSRRTGGAGLGLAICQNIVTAHNGSIAAAPSEYGGVRIKIEIPIAGESNT